MIMTFIAQGMRSKKITRIEHKLAINLKHTQSKIWSEFNKEMNYLRRVFNELQLSKVKVKEHVSLSFSILFYHASKRERAEPRCFNVEATQSNRLFYTGSVKVPETLGKSAKAN